MTRNCTIVYNCVMFIKSIDLTSAREDLSNLVDEVFLDENRAYVVYKRKIPLAMLVKFKPEVGIRRMDRGKIDMSLFGIWKGKKRSEIMASIKSKAWKDNYAN